MTSVWDFSATQVSNNGSVPAGFPSGAAPSSVKTEFQYLMAFLTEGVHSIQASGTTEAFTASLTNIPSSLTDGMQVLVRAVGANTTSTASFGLSTYSAHTVTKFGGTALNAGDIAGANHELLMRYNLANTRWELLNPATAKQPTRTILNTGTALTYNTPSGCVRLRIKMAGPGGGGGGAGTSGGNNANPGAGNTSFTGSNVTLTAGPGNGGTNTGAPGAGGTAAVSGSAVTWSLSQAGNSGQAGGSFVNTNLGGTGGAGPWGGAGSQGANADTNSGAGGGGGQAGGGGQDNIITGGGGGAGAFIEAQINNPPASFTYSVPLGGTGGIAGSSGGAGGNGAQGRIVIDEYYF